MVLNYLYILLEWHSDDVTLHLETHRDNIASALDTYANNHKLLKNIHG